DLRAPDLRRRRILARELRMRDPAVETARRYVTRRLRPSAARERTPRRTFPRSSRLLRHVRANELACLDAADEAQGLRQVDAIRVCHAGAVAVRHVRVHGQDDVRAAEQIRAAGIAEANAALALRRIRGQLDELDALDVVALNELARREEAREQEHLSR